ncbi:hypothetical protein KAR91_55850 [Candidatus Pacearchaeota archaeon]|nr:hypothetical protein [Candidatus Pacearchaeota archaeon]
MATDEVENDDVTENAGANAVKDTAAMDMDTVETDMEMATGTDMVETSRFVRLESESMVAKKFTEE